jgi:hypothetical protein
MEGERLSREHAHFYRRRSRTRVTIGAAVSTIAILMSTATASSAADDDWHDQAALNTSCVEYVDGLGKADRCRFEPWTKENFTGNIVRVSGDTANCNDINATKSMTWSQSSTEENSIQVSVSVEAKLSPMYSASISTTYGHSWSHTTTESSTEAAPVPARSIAWIERGSPMQRVTGRTVINYPKRRHGHFEWYTYPTLVNADPQALGFDTMILRSRPMTATELQELCDIAPAKAATLSKADKSTGTTSILRGGIL